MTPKTLFDLLVFLGLTASAGFAEELVFRGYLSQQFSAWTGSYSIAVILQGIVFGLPTDFTERLCLPSWARMAAGTSCLLAKEPTSGNARTWAARQHRRDRRVLFINERQLRSGAGPTASLPERQPGIDVNGR